MLQSVSYFLIFGKPLIMYLGILTLCLFLLVAAIAVMNKKGIRTIPFSWHPRMAVIAICCAVIHGVLGILAFF
jgi:hypothetical protein